MSDTAADGGADSHYGRSAVALTFGQVEEVLATASMISPERRGPFQARLKQWQKAPLYFPDGVNVGRGGRAAYKATQLYQLAFMIRLLAAGMPPERAIYTVRTGWPVFKDAIVEATECLARRDRHLHYMMIQMDALGPLQAPGEHIHLYVSSITSELLVDALGGSPDEYAPEEREAFKFFQFMVKNTLVNVIILEVDSIIMRVWGSMAKLGLSTELIKEEVAQWEAERRERGSAEQPAEERNHFAREIVDNLQELLPKLDISEIAATSLGRAGEFHQVAETMKKEAEAAPWAGSVPLREATVLVKPFGRGLPPVRVLPRDQAEADEDYEFGWDFGTRDATDDELMNQMLSLFVELTIRYQIPAPRVHAAFVAIPEYVQSLSDEANEDGGSFTVE